MRLVAKIFVPFLLEQLQIAGTEGTIIFDCYDENVLVSIYSCDPLKLRYKKSSRLRIFALKFREKFLGKILKFTIDSHYYYIMQIPDDFLGRVYFSFNLTNPDSPYYVAVVSQHLQL